VSDGPPARSALDGVTVIDACAMMPGQFTAMILGDLGARVIKIERPGTGDFARSGVPGSFEAVNRNKESVTLDLKRPEAREVLHRLVARAHVFLEGFRPGVAERLGASYETLRAVRPDLVYLSLSGYGQTGPYRDRTGHDPNYLAAAGVLWLAGDPDGPPEGVVGASMADLAGTFWSAISVLAALQARSRHGIGQYIDMSLADAAYSLMTSRMVEYLLAGRPPKADVMARPGIGVFACADGRYLSVAAVEDHFWDAFCGVIGRDDWLADPRLRRNRDRRAHAREIRAALPAIFAARPRGEWLDELVAAGVPAAPVNDLGEAADDPYAAARDLLSWIDHPVLGKLPQVRFAGRLEGTPATIRTRPPLLGEHTESVLAELGYADSERAALRGAGVV
jgi:crotonobetainyl-CoA:carnitine CoA-transferase CaiB-like acyl-CoA transferase